VSDKIKNGEKMLLPASQKTNQQKISHQLKAFFIQLVNTFKLILTETVGTA
jgi:hypothetical protein